MKPKIIPLNLLIIIVLLVKIVLSVVMYFIYVFVVFILTFKLIKWEDIFNRKELYSEDYKYYYKTVKDKNPLDTFLRDCKNWIITNENN